jgi:hypothetical protein
VERYAATHPGTRAAVDDDGLTLSGAVAGASARLVPLLAVEWPAGVAEPELVPHLVQAASRPVVIGLLLLRRGGYAVGVAEGGRLLASKVGTRYVQSRTAAGGWSQQRFARRREGQAKDLVGAAAAAWLGLQPPAGTRPSGIVTGGDRAMCERLLVALHPPLGPVLRHLDVPDPRQAILVQAAERARAIRVTIVEP